MNMRKLVSSFGVEIFFLLVFAGVMLYQSAPEMLVSLKPAVSFQDLLDGEEVKPGSRVEGNVVYSLDYFASESTYTKRSDGSRSGSKKSGKYYLIPTAGGFIGLKSPQSNVEAMDKLTDETYEILISANPETLPTTEVFMQGSVKEMEGSIANYYREYLQDAGYSEDQIEALGTPLVIEYVSFGAVRAIFGIGVGLVLLAFLIVGLRYKKAMAGSGLRRAEDLPDNPVN